jgi:hypothetical protein
MDTELATDIPDLLEVNRDNLKADLMFFSFFSVYLQ